MKKFLKYFLVLFIFVPAVVGFFLPEDINASGENPVVVKSHASAVQPPAGPDCENFGAFIVKVNPEKTGKWLALANAASRCEKKSDDPQFPELVARYLKKDKEKKAKIAWSKKMVSKLGPKPIGAAAKAYIRKVARDPSSVRDVECDNSRVSSDENYWVQTCAFKGKNAFGGYVSNKIEVKIRDNVVVGTIQ